MPRYYFPKKDDVLTHDLRTSCRYILCVDEKDVNSCVAELCQYLTNIKSVYMRVLRAYQEVQYLVSTNGVTTFRSDFFITLAEYVEEKPNEDNAVLFSGAVSDSLEEYATHLGLTQTGGAA